MTGISVKYLQKYVFFLIVVDSTTKLDYYFICVLLDVWEVETIAKYLPSMPKYASRQVLSTET